MVTEQPVADPASLPEPEPGANETRRKLHGWERALLIASPVLVAVLIASTFIGLPYVVFAPGRADPVQDAVTIDGAESYPMDGSILFLTVRVTTQRPNVWRVLQGWIDDDHDVMSEDDYFGDTSRSDTRRIDDLMMVRSQDVAKEVALRSLGYDVPVVGSEIGFVSPDGPSAGLLQLGDDVLAVAGTPTTSPESVATAVRTHAPGDEVVVTVSREGSTVEVPVTLGANDDGQALLGISSLPIYDFPVDIQIDTGSVSGPSAGLAFTLTIIDELTTGELTGGKTVAMTGTIDEAGNVGRVGGVKQKTVAARAAGAELILVPKGEEAEAESRAGDVPVVGVATLDEAIDALIAAGGDPIPEKLAA